MSQVIVIILSMVLADTTVSPDPKSLIVSDADHARVEALVEQLGSVLYQERSSATMQLRTMGRLALSSLEVAKLSDNPEVRQRAKLILPTARRADFQARLDVFLADKAGKYDHRLPGWDEFQSITGKNEAGRLLFIELMQSPPNRALVQAVALNPKELNQRVHRRQAEIYRLMYPRQFPGVKRLPSSQPTFTDAMGLIFAEAILGEAKSRIVARVPIMQGYNIMSRSDIRKQIEAEPDTSPAHKLVLAWCDSRTQSAGLYQAMLLTERFKWPETRKYAIKVLEGKVPSVYYIGKSATILGQHGSRADAKFLQPYLDNESIVRRANKSWKEIQVRDIALAMMVLMIERDLDDFDIRTRNTNSKVLNYTNFYFDSPKDRTNALAKWNTLEPDLAVKPKK